MAALEHEDELLKELCDSSGIGPGGIDDVAADRDRRVRECALDQPEVLIAAAEERNHQVGISDDDFGDRARRNDDGRGFYGLSERRGQPGGHSIVRPARTCRWRCGTLESESGPMFMTKR